MKRSVQSRLKMFLNILRSCLCGKKKVSYENLIQEPEGYT